MTGSRSYPSSAQNRVADPPAGALPVSTAAGKPSVDPPARPTAAHPVRVALRLAVAHHPLCHYFHDDTFGRRWPVCRGCAVLWPLFLPLSILLVAWLPRLPLSPGQAFAVGAVLGLPQVATAAIRFRPAERVAVKAIGAVGLALLVAGLLWAPVPWSWKAAAAVAVLGGFTVLLAIRVRGILRTCRACPWAMDWEHCPGMLGWRPQRQSTEMPRPEGP